MAVGHSVDVGLPVHRSLMLAGDVGLVECCEEKELQIVPNVGHGNYM